MTQWQTFLSSQQAEFTEGYVKSFGYPQKELQAALEGNVLTDLSHLGLLQIDGEDRVSFLQGQVTNDVKQLVGNNAHYTGYCTPKGRMLALFLAFAHHDHLHLQVNRQLLEATMKRLKMYVLRSKAVITDVSDSIVRIGFAGNQAEAALQSLFNQVPHKAYELVSLDDAALIRLPGNTPRFEIFTPPEQAERTWLALSQQATLVGAPCWEWLEITAGIPDISADTLEAFVPQMINLDALGGISFKKGCYTGQEIVARTHYLGKVKRRTLLVHIDAETSGHAEPKPGNPLYIAGNDDPAGILVRAAPSPAGGFMALAEVRLEAIEGTDIYLDQQSKSPLQVLQLPYALS